MKFILIIAILFTNFTFAAEAQASTCRNYDQNQVCILTIKRSAKYYWRYRTQIKINGVKQPMMIYDCRQQKKFTKDGIATPFQKIGIEHFICDKLNR